MKILIAVDMEGISGVTCWNHVDSTPHPEYQRFRRIMTQDVNAAIAGAVAGGADEILVTDGHGYGRNILIEELDPRARIHQGTPSPFSMVEGIDSGVQAAMFIGYHAHMSTANAVLAHTWSCERVLNVWLNSRIVGEIALNASVCGSFGVPVLMISGDQAACDEASEWIPGIATAPVKKATSRFAAECLPPEVSQPLIRKTAKRTVAAFLAGQSTSPLSVTLPVEITIEFLNTVMADAIILLPNIRRLDGRRVEFEAGSMPEAYRLFRAVVSLAPTSV
jgi:D-amino peptidase